MHLGKRAIAEFLGTFWVVFGGWRSAVISAAYPQLGIGFLGVALAFGLTVVTMAYAVGHISGAHFNPAITIGLWAGRRIPFRDVVPYVVFQVAGRSPPRQCSKSWRKASRDLFLALSPRTATAI